MTRLSVRGWGCGIQQMRPEDAPEPRWGGGTTEVSIIAHRAVHLHWALGSWVVE